MESRSRLTFWLIQCFHSFRYYCTHWYRCNTSFLMTWIDFNDPFIIWAVVAWNQSCLPAIWRSWDRIPANRRIQPEGSVSLVIIAVFMSAMDQEQTYSGWTSSIHLEIYLLEGFCLYLRWILTWRRSRENPIPMISRRLSALLSLFLYLFPGMLDIHWNIYIDLKAKF